MAKHYGADSMMSTCAQSSLVRGHRSVAGLLLALALCLPLTASAGLDPRFGSGGKLFLDFPASAFTLDAFGNLYVAGATCGASCQLTIAKFDSTGAPVRSFGTNGTALISIGANSYASGIALDGSGNLYVSGVTEDAAHTLTSRAFAVVKLDSKGNLVTTFGDAGKQVVKYATDSVDEPPVGVVLTPAGSVYLSGTSIYGGTQFTVAKLDSSGNLSWLRAVRFGNNDFLNHGDRLSETVADPAGNLFVAGITVGIQVPAPFCEIAKLDSAGALIPSFGSGGKRIVALTAGQLGCTTIAQDRNGNVYIAGADNNAIRIVKLDANGNEVNGFGVNGVLTIDVGPDDYASRIKFDTRGNLWVFGYTATGFVPGFPLGTETYSLVIAKIDPNGNLAADFGSGGKQVISIGLSDYATSGAVDGGGGVYVLGQTSVANQPQSVIVKLTELSSADIAIPTLSNLAVAFLAGLVAVSGAVFVGRR